MPGAAGASNGPATIDMSQVLLTLNGRTYRMRCGEGEEQRLEDLTAHVQKHVDTLVRDFGQIGDDRLLLMAALKITDELWDARGQSDDAGSDQVVPEVAEVGDGGSKS